jgi:hypothetical protein
MAWVPYDADQRAGTVSLPTVGLQYTTMPARYAKGMTAVHCVSDGSGWATLVMLFCKDLNMRWSGRERAYIASPSKVRKLETMVADAIRQRESRHVTA